MVLRQRVAGRPGRPPVGVGHHSQRRCRELRRQRGGHPSLDAVLVRRGMAGGHRLEEDPSTVLVGQHARDPPHGEAAAGRRDVADVRAQPVADAPAYGWGKVVPGGATGHDRTGSRHEDARVGDVVPMAVVALDGVAVDRGQVPVEAQPPVEPERTQVPGVDADADQLVPALECRAGRRAKRLVSVSSRSARTSRGSAFASSDQRRYREEVQLVDQPGPDRLAGQFRPANRQVVLGCCLEPAHQVGVELTLDPRSGAGRGGQRPGEDDLVGGLPDLGEGPCDRRPTRSRRPGSPPAASGRERGR